MKKMTIRAKITLWFSALLIVIFSIMFTLMLVINRHVLYTNVEESLKTIVNNNKDEIEFTEDFESDDVEPGDHYLHYGDGYLEIDDDFVVEWRGVYTALFDDKGKLIYGRPPVSAPITEDGRIVSQTVEEEKYYVYCVKLTEYPFDGLILQGIVSEDAQETIITRSVDLSILILPFMVLVAIVGGYILSGRLLKPIRKIADTAEGINDGTDLSQRIELNPGGDELHQLAYSFNRMMDRLEHAFENEKQFVSDISHELRTPVSTILAQTELTLEKERTAEEYRKAMELIQRQSGHMKQLVNEMLWHSRLENMEMLHDKEEIDLSQLVEMIAEEQMLNSQKGIRLSYQVEPELYIEGNTELLIRLLLNLISNAYQYGKQDGSIVVTLSGAGPDICLSVKDDGIGMDAAESSKIFQRFYQVDASRRSPEHSLGLGLSIVAEIVRLHQAVISVESEKGKGSEFKIFLKKLKL